MRNFIQSLIIIAVMLVISSCCKDKKKDEGCVNGNYRVSPFLQRFGIYYCSTNNLPFQYIFWNKEQIDSLQNVCYFYAGAVYPLNHLPNLYMVTADTLYNYTDTITGEVFIDTCKRR